MSETLDGALAELFGGSAAPRGEAVPAAAAAPGDAALRALIVEARTHYESAMAAQRAGDWAHYGDEIRLLGELLARIGAGPAPRR